MLVSVVVKFCPHFGRLGSDGLDDRGFRNGQAKTLSGGTSATGRFEAQRIYPRSRTSGRTCQGGSSIVVISKSDAAW